MFPEFYWKFTKVPWIFPVFWDLQNVFNRYQLESPQRILADTVENTANLNPRRIRIRLPAEDDIDCVVPGEISVRKAYKVCYISI